MGLPSTPIAAVSHGIIREPKGVIWLIIGPTILPRHGGLGRIDAKTQKLDIFVPALQISGTGGSLDYDGKGKIWASTPVGAVRFDPQGLGTLGCYVGRAPGAMA